MHALPANTEGGNVASLNLPVHLVFGRCLFRLKNADIMVTSLTVVWVKSVCILKTPCKLTLTSKLGLRRKAIALAFSAMKRRQISVTGRPAAKTHKIPRRRQE